MAGRGRGRGGFAPGQLKGATWEHDATIKLESKPSDLFPLHPNLKRPAPLSEREIRQIRYYTELQTQIHRGPLFTQPSKRDPDAPAKTFNEDQINSQYGSNRQEDMDPFNGVETYSMRYAPKKNVLPKLSDRPFIKELFPEELWATFESKEVLGVRKMVNGTGAKRQRLNAGDRTEAMLQRLEDFEDAEEDEDAEGEGAGEEVDDEFADEDLGDDYNAEQYFDDGDAEEDDGGGDGRDDY